MDDNRPKSTNDIQSFEMGEENPKINNYAAEAKRPPLPPKRPMNPPVNPTNKVEMPPVPVPSTPTVTPTVPPKPAQPAGSGSSPIAKKKVILGCLGAFGSILLIFLILSFVFLGQTDKESNPIAKLLGLDPAVFINGLIVLVHSVFFIVAMVTLVLAVVSVFRASAAKKDDKFTKQLWLKRSLFAGISFLVVLIIWFFVFVYLDAKRMEVVGPELAPIITTPEDTTNLTAPIEIKFDASNVPTDKNFQILSYKWDFDDGETGTNQVVTHLFTTKGDGRYDVELTVTKKNKETGEEVEDKYVAIVTIGNQALSAVIKADPEEGEAPLEVKFDGSESVDPDGTIDKYEWDLDGDGQFDDGNSAKAEYKYEKVGKYTVSLRVTSTTDEYNVAEKEIVVGEKQLPEVKITINDDPGTYTVGEEYIFKGDESTSPNGEIKSYEWDFGDGTKVEKSRNVTHKFNKAGNYDITLKVIDEKDKEGEGTLTLKVDNPQGTPKAVISSTPAAINGTLEGSVPLAVNFDASLSTDSDNNIVDYQWDFDGNEVPDSFGKTVSHTFTEEGTYKVILFVKDATDKTSSAELIVKAKAEGIAAVLKTDKVDGQAPLTVKFDASGSRYIGGQITSYKWNFGDGSPEKFGSAVISHKYTSIGTYTATVTAIGSDNTTSTAQQLITIREVPLSACFSSVFTTGKAPLTTSFNPSCSSGTIFSYFWTFGDGGNSTQSSPTHTFENPGTYTVKLEITDAENTVSEAEKTITVTE